MKGLTKAQWINRNRNNRSVLACQYLYCYNDPISVLAPVMLAKLYHIDKTGIIVWTIIIAPVMPAIRSTIILAMYTWNNSLDNN